jgi:chlorobactene glucosyltransferase
LPPSILWTFWIISLIWIVTLIYNLACARSAPYVPRARNVDFETAALTFETGKAPFVSILVPARNEGQRILAPAILSMLAQNYPAYEVIVVDDRSTDNTLSVLNEIAAGDKRLKVISGTPLPKGWLGKPWALHQAERTSRGQWLLATDADMIFSTDALSQSVSVAVREGYDALSLIPALGSQGFWERVIMPVAGWSILMLYPFWRVNSPRSKVALGAGGFFLIRRTALDQVGGYSAVRREIVEDVAMARLLKTNRLRLNLSAGPAICSTPMYLGLKEVFDGFSKNAFAGSGSSVSRVLLLSFMNLALAALPALTTIAAMSAFAFTGGAHGGGLLLAAGTAYLTMVLSFVPVYSRARVPVQYALWAWLANLTMILILLSSTWRIVTGRGVTWKSRNLYPHPSDESTEAE